MKFLFFFIAFLSPPCLAEQICFEIPDEWRTQIEDSVIDMDEWIYDAVQGKANKSKERLLKRETERMIQENEPIPAGEAAILEKIYSDPEYKDREKREIEATKIR